MRSSRARAGSGAIVSSAREAAATWPAWVVWGPRAAAAWSVAYAALGLWWTSGRGEFPFGVGPASGPASSLLHGLPRAMGAPAVAVLGAIGVAVALAVARSRRAPVTAPTVAFAWAQTLALLVLVPDARVIATAAYAPLFLLGAPFGWPPMSFALALQWEIVNQHLCIVGGVCWGATALTASRLARGACLACGRGGGRAGGARWTSPAAARRWGRWAVVAAVLAPLPYAATRMAWAFGIPLGGDPRVIDAARQDAAAFPAAGLALVAIAGAVLTLGLVRPWGEVFPRWLPALRGCAVPPMLAVAPAGVATVLLLTSAFGLLRSSVGSGTNLDLMTLAWLVWGIALGAATLAYHLRRRGQCAACGRR